MPVPPPLPYRGLLGLSYSNPGKLGSLFAQTQGAQIQVDRDRRAKLLAQLVQEGKLKQQDLTPQDLALAAPKLGSVDKPPDGSHLGGSFLGKVGGLFSNIGHDAEDYLKNLPAGVVGLGKGLWEDSTGASTGIPGRSVVGSTGFDEGKGVKGRVIDPMVESYKYTYGGVGAPEGSSFLGRVYAHPLGPILDVASVFSLGAGAAARGTAFASKSGWAAAQPGSKLHDIFLSTAREPLESGTLPGSHLAKGESVPTIPREYSTRPNRRILQYSTDQVAKIPYLGRPVEATQRRLAQTSYLRHDFSTKELQGNAASAREAIEPLVPLLNKLTPHEIAAIPLIGMRINSPRLLEIYQNAVREGIAGDAPKGQNVPAAIGEKTPELPESRAHLSGETKLLAADPTLSPPLMEFLNKYTERLRSRVHADVGDAGKVQELVDMPREALLARMGEALPSEPVNPGEYHPFNEGFLIPSQVSSDVKFNQPGRLGRMLGKRAGFSLGRGRNLNAQTMGYQDFLRTPSMSMRPNVDALLSGATRPDARQFVDYLTKHERDKIEKAFSEESVYNHAVKDKDGQPVTVDGKLTVEQVQAEFGKDFVPVNPSLPWHFYNKEFTVGQAVSGMQDAGFDMSEIAARVGAEAEDMGLDMTLVAQRVPNVVVPKSFADYQLALARAHRPYETKGARAVARMMNFWRTYTLTYMARWALNTAVGSFALATVKGISPRQYYVAQKLRAVGGKEGLKGLQLGKGEKGFYDRPEMAGVNLASIGAWDQLEMGAFGHSNQAVASVGVVQRNIMRRVQQIEDHFRRASFVQSLDKRIRQSMNEQGAIIRGFEESRGPRTIDEYADYISHNPEQVQHAINDLNRFSYNFSTLGPFERRYVRQLIPFWGWYKFISGLAYRLPVDYPGRSLVMARIGEMGSNSQQEKYGDTPSWLKGALGLSPGPKNFRYLSTMGLNPLSQIFNPFGSEGPIGGSVQMSQGSPLIQSLLSAYGVDTMRGGEVPISPQTLHDANVGHGIWGELRTFKGQEKDPWQVAGGKRLLASLMRSFPQFRIWERQQAGGRSSFPESLPWAPRPMGTKPESRFGGVGSEVLEQLIGIAPRPYDLKGWQSLAPKSGDYARSRNRNELKKLNKSLKK